MNLNLQNKIFLISGGTKGLGYGTAKALLEEGATVSIGSRNEENLTTALSSLSEFGNKVRGYTLDASNLQSITEWVTASLKDLGRIDTDRVRSLDTIIANKTSKSIEDIINKHHQDIPLGRYGTIEEFGAVAAFLLSDKASYITGSNVVVDGGKIRSL